MKTNITIFKTLILSFFIIIGSLFACAENNDDISAESVSIPAPIVRVTETGIEITLSGDDYKNLSIYALTGQIVKSQSVVPGTTAIELSRGYYIVRVGSEAKRVVIK